MPLYVNCTETYKTKLNTGIQRVVRKIAEHGNCTPVHFDGIGFLPISFKELYPSKGNPINKLRNLLIRIPLLYPFAKHLFNLLYSLKAYTFFLNNKNRYLEFREGDILLSADLVRGEKLLQTLKIINIPVYQIVYDILPITHPNFFNKEAVAEFVKVSSQWPHYSTKIFAISKKVAREVEENLHTSKVDFFYLGSDFVESNTHVSSTIFEDFFLTVGTIEPRKGHIHVLKTFLDLWNEGSQENLIFIGRKGWEFSTILQLIEIAQKNYPERFSWLDSVNDKELESYYLKSKAVICPSVDEGFGLPIVEALSRKKNVLCSDIEVFREIGADFCTYFDFESEGPKSLNNIIKHNLFKVDVSSFKWLTWKEAVDILNSKIMKDAK